MWALSRKHTKHNTESQKQNRGPGNGHREPVAGVDGSRDELRAAPDNAAEDRGPPSEVVPRDGETEERLSGGWGDEREKA